MPALLRGAFFNKFLGLLVILTAVLVLACCMLPRIPQPQTSRPSQFFHVDALPVLGTGKIDLRGVKALAAALA
jgi:hypothetical protein